MLGVIWVIAFLIFIMTNSVFLKILMLIVMFGIFLHSHNKIVEEKNREIEILKNKLESKDFVIK